MLHHGSNREFKHPMGIRYIYQLNKVCSLRMLTAKAKYLCEKRSKMGLGLRGTRKRIKAHLQIGALGKLNNLRFPKCHMK